MHAAMHAAMMTAAASRVVAFALLRCIYWFIFLDGVLSISVP
jgi:hypothetical protein